MADPAQTFIAFLLALLAGEGSAPPPAEKAPEVGGATAVCDLQLTQGQLSQTFMARLHAAPDQAIRGTYVLLVEGPKGSRITIDDARDVSLTAGQSLVLGTLFLDAGTQLSGSLTLLAADGDTICHDTL